MVVHKGLKNQDKSIFMRPKASFGVYFRALASGEDVGFHVG